MSEAINWIKSRWPDVAICAWIVGFFGGVANLIPMWLCAILVLPAYGWLFWSKRR